MNRAVNDLLLQPSVFRATLNAALACTGDGRDDAIAAVLDEGIDAPLALQSARHVVTDALTGYMTAVNRELVARFGRGTHVRPGVLDRGLGPARR